MKRLIIFEIVVIAMMLIIVGRLFFIQVIDKDYYQNKKNSMTKKIVEGETAPRGRIYDRNGILLVDNKPNKVIYYHSDSKLTKEEKIDIITCLSSIIDLDIKKVTIKMLKDYYLFFNSDIQLITQEELESYKNRALSYEDIMKIKYSRISDKDLESIDKEKAYIYYLMDNGYSYMDKVIKDQDVTDYEYAVIAENLERLKGVGIKLDWQREYIYGDIFKSIFGRTGDIPSEELNYYLEKGYSKTDIVGISYLEYQYDDFLKGTKNKYLVNSNGNYSLIEEGKKGNDIYLSVDILLQQQIENIIIESLMNAKKEPNTTYLNKSFVIISNPQTGEIYAMAGKQIIDGNIYDYTPGIITNSYVVGSTVKGASQIVGYNTNALKIGEVRDDACIKIKSTNEKCSWKYLGIIDDLMALKYSSNTYQFRTAIKVGGGNYTYNSSLALNEEAFNIYRTTFNEFGLGVITQIDLPNEKLGYRGTTKNTNLLLNFSIGQYDTYTPIELLQYINTIANNGTRIKPYLVQKVLSNDNEILYEGKKAELNSVNTKGEYINRVREGFKQVLELYGTGYNYINPIYMPAGKTGTSQSFLDSNLDGKIDTETVSTAFVGYAPHDNPTFSIAVITPDVSDYSTGDYTSYVTRVIARRSSDAYFLRY